MKLIMFLLLSFVVCTITFVSCHYFTKWWNKVYDKWMYNKGICRKCGHKLTYITTDKCFNVYVCDNCNNLIIVDKNNTQTK